MTPTVTTPHNIRSAYALEGLTCGACLAEVMETVLRLPHVTGVGVDLGASGRSALVVRSDLALLPQVVIEAVQGAGFRAVPVSRRRARYLQGTFTGKRRRPPFRRGTSTCAQ